VPVCTGCGRESEGEFQFCPYCGAQLGAEPVPLAQRKTVTVLFCDLTGSTALGEAVDPEALRALLARYFERMKTFVESHGGTVEKFIGDAVMAVFGVPVAHEDDALRAVRAAVEMRDALPELGVQARIGVNTGEVVTGTAERLATGDAVNVAARLEQAAAPGEILLGEPTLRLVREAVEIETVEPLDLKGKSERVTAYRLVTVREPPERGLGPPMVGREAELAELRAAFAQAVADRSCRLFTVVGEAGVGKSRLVREVLLGLEAAVAVGRCLPYGKGITYWPVVEVLKQLGVRPADTSAAAAIASLLRESEVGATAEEIAWAVRKTLEQAAAEGPLVVVFDDIQWGEQTFLDLVEHVALLTSEAPILLLCMARPELPEHRSGWPVDVRLEPLADEAVERLLPETIDVELRGRIARAAGGNPLFVQEMVAMTAEAQADVVVPATLRGLLAARLDQLEPAERRVLESAAVEGEVFHRGSMLALGAGEVQVTPRLAALVRKQLIGSHRPRLEGEDGFRFRHLLIRDVAYESLTKGRRAQLHERLATWLEQRGQDLVEVDEIAGYHLEQAARYAGELGQPDSALAERAGDHLTAAGRRALWRVDEPAAATLLERALELTRPLRLDVHLELDHARVFTVADPQRAATLAQAAAERARAVGDEAGEALANVVAAGHRLWFAPHADLDEYEAQAAAALPLLEEAGDHFGLADVWQALAGVADNRNRFEDMAQASEEAIRYARLAGRPRSLTRLSLALLSGPRPADEALRVLDAAQPEPNSHPEEMLLRAVLLAMLDRFEEAWPLAHTANDRLRALRGSLEEGWLAQIALFEGDYEAAARHLRRSCDAAEERGMRNVVAGYAPKLARVLCKLGRLDEAAPLAQLGRRCAAEHDIWAQVLWRRGQALVDARSGNHVEAERLAREAVAIAERTDALNDQGEALCDLAEVLAAAGRTEEAGAALGQAVDRYERKKNLAMVAQLRERLAVLPRRDLPASTASERPTGVESRDVV
jgi:class 3 adenylate cyclase/tetratricopeptide (TPR) repeat protein